MAPRAAGWCGALTHDSDQPRGPQLHPSHGLRLTRVNRRPQGPRIVLLIPSAPAHEKLHVLAAACKHTEHGICYGTMPLHQPLGHAAAEGLAQAWVCGAVDAPDGRPAQPAHQQQQPGPNVVSACMAPAHMQQGRARWASQARQRAVCLEQRNAAMQWQHPAVG